MADKVDLKVPYAKTLSDHSFMIVKVTWEKIEPVRYRLLSFSKDRVVCVRCGLVIDPFPEVTQ